MKLEIDTDAKTIILLPQEQFLIQKLYNTIADLGIEDYMICLEEPKVEEYQQPFQYPWSLPYCHSGQISVGSRTTTNNPSSITTASYDYTDTDARNLTSR